MRNLNRIVEGALDEDRFVVAYYEEGERLVAACPSQVFVVEEEDDRSELTLTINDQDM